jgi:hypothetical protein
MENEPKTSLARKYTVVCGFGALLLLAGCERVSPPTDLTSVSISLARACGMLPCPSYTITIHGNGVVDYDGKDQVPVIGHRSATIAQEKIVTILQEMDRMRFMSDTERDFSAGTDTSSMTILISFDGKTMRMRGSRSDGFAYPTQEAVKRMNPRARAQLNFMKLADDIDAAARTDRWTKCSPSCTTFLYHHGTSINAVDSNGQSVLLRSIRKKEPLNFEGLSVDPHTLIEAGVDVNLADSKGTTPLMAAAEKGDADLVRNLLAHGALTVAKDKRGRTAFDLCNVPEIRNLLTSPLSVRGDT